MTDEYISEALLTQKWPLTASIFFFFVSKASGDKRGGHLFTRAINTLGRYLSGISVNKKAPGFEEKLMPLLSA